MTKGRQKSGRTKNFYLFISSVTASAFSSTVASSSTFGEEEFEFKTMQDDLFQKLENGLFFKIMQTR